MKLDAFKKLKTWLIIIALVVAVVGMVILGVLGFNKTADNVNSYEVKVSVDQDIKGSAQKAKETAENNLEGYSTYAVQTINEGTVIVFKFTDAEDVLKINKSELKSKLEQSINNANVNVDVEINEVVVNNDLEIGYFAGALAIVAVVALLYLFIMERFAAGLAALGSTIISVLLSIAMFAITRVPVYPMLGVSIAASAALALMLSAGLANRFKEERKKASNANANFSEMADVAVKASVTRFGFVAIAVMVAAISLIILGLGYLSFFGVMLAIADVCAVFVTYTFMPIIWASLAKKK